MSKSKKPIVISPEDLKNGKAEEKIRSAIASELPGMPEGKVPAHVREVAEQVVRLDLDIAKMKDDLKREQETLLDKMEKAEVPVVVVIVGKWKYRIRCKTGKQKLVIEDVGMASEKPAKEPAAAGA